ncbi:mucoidy inhibitor MuiA family protein [Kitasatospora cathayae]|uniref:Mucoidy inhibitor MuiA family protein n=1 Tax=Kitasatospora cathayae TaxID=3004092 RepID=A0ABY7Q1Q3_9ACTN|nr:mucoidy inhibitor MuiA family protein [Kitasatospora sp. HUAS 3-15]WBP86377.1 mucoidy inhibitor MuiA family protein [Kitasatospora sp. HUAS 3-15]
MDDQHSSHTGPSKPPAVPAHPSVLDSVVVYAEGAVCRRRATVPVPPGRRLRLTGLPDSLDADSLRARVLAGPAGTAVVEARLEAVAELREPDELPQLRRELDEAMERQGALNERHRLVRSAIAETAALRAVPPQRRRDEPLRRTPADAWLELADFVDERLARLQERAEQLTQEIELADHERQLAADRLERASTAGRAEPIEATDTVVLTLTTTGTGTEQIELELEYGVPAARWVPAYRLSHRTGSDTAHLVLRAAVAQHTGEDWTGVRLALSTADLDRRTDLPRLASLRIGRSQPAPPPSGWREPPAGLSDLFTGYDAAAADRPATTRPGAPIPVAALSAPEPALRRAPRVGGARPAGAQPDFRPDEAAPAAPAGPAGPSGGGGGGGSLSVQEPVPSPPPPGFAGYGAPPVTSAPPTPSTPSAPTAPAPMPQAPGGTPMPQSYGGAPPRTARRRATAPPPPTALTPDTVLLDYPDLRLAGPDDTTDRRGTLRPDPARVERAELARFAPGGPEGARLRDLPLPRHAVPPRRSAGSFDHRFDAAAPADIPSDGTWHSVTVDAIPLSVSPEYVTVPAVEQKVYATLVLANRTDRAVLAGPVEVTVDDEFLLTAALPTLAPGETRRLGIGVTESIEVARRTELHESATGMLKGNSTVLDHRVHVQLANRLGRAATVEVRERVPVASDAEIRIEERADWQAPAVPTPECPAGTRLWRIELPPGGRTELDGGYQIKIPAGKAIVGGNRRN